MALSFKTKSPIAVHLALIISKMGVTYLPRLLFKTVFQVSAFEVNRTIGRIHRCQAKLVFLYQVGGPKRFTR
jgi:hypothetical protein